MQLRIYGSQSFARDVKKKEMSVSWNGRKRARSLEGCYSCACRRRGR